MKPRCNTPHDDAGSQQRNTPGGIWGRSSAEDQEAKKFRASVLFFKNIKNPKSEKLRGMYVGAGASAVVRQLLLRHRNYGTVQYICRNYGRKAPGPVVIHRQACPLAIAMALYLTGPYNTCSLQARSELARVTCSCNPVTWAGAWLEGGWGVRVMLSVIAATAGRGGPRLSAPAPALHRAGAAALAAGPGSTTARPRLATPAPGRAIITVLRGVGPKRVARPCVHRRRESHQLLVVHVQRRRQDPDRLAHHAWPVVLLRAQQQQKAFENFWAIQ